MISKFRFLVPLLLAVAAAHCQAQTTMQLSNTQQNCSAASPATPEYSCQQNVVAPLYQNWGSFYFTAGTRYAQQVQLVYTGPAHINGIATVESSSIQVVQPYTSPSAPNSYILTLTFSGTDSVTGKPFSGSATLPFEYKYLSSGGRGGHSALYTVSEGGSVTLTE